MLLSILPWVFNPAAWVPNQAMFTVIRHTNDELDVTASIADGDTGPYVFQIPDPDYKQPPSVALLPVGANFFSGQWSLSSLSRTGVGLQKLAGIGTGPLVRLFIRRPR